MRGCSTFAAAGRRSVDQSARRSRVQTQEVWSLAVPAVFIPLFATEAQWQRLSCPANLATMAAFLTHYIYRDVIYPMRMRPGALADGLGCEEMGLRHSLRNDASRCCCRQTHALFCVAHGSGVLHVQRLHAHGVLFGPCASTCAALDEGCFGACAVGRWIFGQRALGQHFARPEKARQSRYLSRLPDRASRQSIVTETSHFVALAFCQDTPFRGAVFSSSFPPPIISPRLWSGSDGPWQSALRQPMPLPSSRRPTWFPGASVITSGTARRSRTTRGSAGRSFRT